MIMQCPMQSLVYGDLSHHQVVAAKFGSALFKVACHKNQVAAVKYGNILSCLFKVWPVTSQR